MVEIKIDLEKCVGDGICVEVCPCGVYELRQDKPVIVNPEKCTDCRVCGEQCPVQAISFEEGGLNG